MTRTTLPFAARRITATVLAGVLAAACADQRTPVTPTDVASLSRGGQGFNYTTIEVPGARATVPQGINAGGDVVGWYVDASNATRGFLLRRGELATISYPGAALTEARGISPDGEIVGTYRMPGEAGWTYHGFLLTKEGEFVQVDYPGKLSTMPQRILPDGSILGCHHGVNFAGMTGVLMGKHGNSETDAPMSMHNGATPDRRRITGLFTDMMDGITKGYLIEDGVFTSFLVPGSNLTAAWDMNPAGQIVGVYRDAQSRVHGFVRTGDEYVSVDVPGAQATQAFGINARGDVVGRYVMGGKSYGFLARR